ncbi:hypothetical protein AJ78_07815 [Emergomyces pasteurianus Ep9510]|uniref:Uncharacterized protein n=1 Tax=Emergomyces pasteurianus Ep9510 TaxID=1447872 RepID=A0A1J9PU76_9EURO|nr:hypothetical protein AJ78_07815 [Emergomyces pasteurianus Ep9510]
MAAAGGGVNFVRLVLFLCRQHDQFKPKKISSLPDLCHSSRPKPCSKGDSHSCESDMHDTYYHRRGKHVKDPQNWHGTFAFKDDDQVEREFLLGFTCYIAIYMTLSQCASEGTNNK